MMQIYAYFCRELDHQFNDADDAQVEEMCRRLDDPENDIRTYELEDGRPILFWRRDGRIHGNIHGHDERDIPESSIANGETRCPDEEDDAPPF